MRDRVSFHMFVEVTQFTTFRSFAFKYGGYMAAYEHEMVAGTVHRVAARHINQLLDEGRGSFRQAFFYKC